MLLLDTQFLVWLLADCKKIPSKYNKIYDLAYTEKFFFSPISLTEISIKISVNKFPYDLTAMDFHQQALKNNMSYLQYTAEAAHLVATLPLHHRDPFDRMLLAQAKQNDLTLVTIDQIMHKYDVKILES